MRDPTVPPPGQVITELHAWIATYAEGGQGIIAAILPGLGSAPLVSSKRSHMTMAEGVARHAALLTAGRGNGEVVSVDLVTFQRVQP